LLHTFAGGADGAEPYAGLTVLKGKLYGATGYGGPKKQGTIFTITPSGSESVLHTFARGPGGRVPYASLTAMGGALYGTTLWGGRPPAGVGTLFKFSP